MQPIIVIYGRKEIFENPEILDHYQKSVIGALESKGFDTLCFFMPTDGEERIECINPTILTEEALLNEYTKLVDTLTTLEKRLDMTASSSS